MQNSHYPCNGCHKCFITSKLLKAHRKTCEKVNPPRKKPPSTAIPSRGEIAKKKIPKARERDALNAKKPQTHHVTLGISQNSSHEQIMKAAKEMRIKMHPDRLKRQGGLTQEQKKKIDVEAARVGQPADILSNPELRAKYGGKLRA